MASTQLGRVETKSPWGTGTDVFVFSAEQGSKDTADRVTLAVYTGAASLQFYLTADQCRELAALLILGAVNVKAAAVAEAA